MRSSLDHSFTVWLPLFLNGIVRTAFFDGDSMMQFMQRPLAWFLSAMLLLMPMMPAQAAMVGTDQIINQTDSGLTREKLQQFLDREATRKQLQAWGVSPEQIKERVSRLTDMEL
ncbi:MAG: PA2779 family protein, partial [Gammaproteobacteria bacterium]|nr:PA2779 family protein [Gammaproteobacteria bacterium]